MANTKDLVVKYLDEARLMQIATCSLPEREKSSELGPLADSDLPTSDEKNRRLVSLPQPWCATVYFAVDNLHNIFWLSRADRRHSREIAINPKVAGTIVLPHNYGDKVRGLQFRGLASELTDQAEITKHIMTIEERYHRPNLGQQIISGANTHRLYRLRPELFALFDEVNFPGGEARAWQL